MIPYKSVTSCRMCEAVRFRTFAGEEQSTFSVKFHYGVVIDGNCVNKLSETEQEINIPVNHLHVQCGNCGYEWVEAPSVGIVTYTLSDKIDENIL